LGLSNNDLQPVRGPKSVGTAKEGSNLKILGQLKNAIHLKLGYHGCHFQDQPIVLDGLAMDFNLSGPFLCKHQINQLHDKRCLGIQGRQVPLLSTLTSVAVIPPKDLSNHAYFADNVIPAHTTQLVQLNVPAVQLGFQPGGDVMLTGRGNFMRSTDLHPWINVISQVNRGGRLTTGVMNTTLHAIKVGKDSRYGQVKLMINEGEKQDFAWRRISLLEAKPDTSVKVMSKTVMERMMEGPLSKWMVVPTTEANQARKIEVLIKRFQLDEKDCLTTAENKVKTAALLLLKYWATLSFNGS
jgi:hypothetical protein